jgi:hypothetical protein
MGVLEDSEIQAHLTKITAQKSAARQARALVTMMGVSYAHA